MSFLDRWFKRKKKEQLADTAGKVKADQKAEPKGEPIVEETKIAKPEVFIPKAGAAASGAYRIIIRPLITEKAAALKSDHNKYSFIVHRAASKAQIKQAVKELYGIDPVMVNVEQVQGRRVRFGRHWGRRSDYKKAIVTLPQGKSITVHEGV